MMSMKKFQREELSQGWNQAAVQGECWFIILEQQLDFELKLGTAKDF